MKLPLCDKFEFFKNYSLNPAELKKEDVYRRFEMLQRKVTEIGEWGDVLIFHTFRNFHIKARRNPFILYFIGGNLNPQASPQRGLWFCRIETIHHGNDGILNFTFRL